MEEIARARTRTWFGFKSGTLVWVQIRNIDILRTTESTQYYDATAYGINFSLSQSNTPNPKRGSQKSQSGDLRNRNTPNPKGDLRNSNFHFFFFSVEMIGALERAK